MISPISWQYNFDQAIKLKVIGNYGNLAKVKGTAKAVRLSQSAMKISANRMVL